MGTGRSAGRDCGQSGTKWIIFPSRPLRFTRTAIRSNTSGATHEGSASTRGANHLRDYYLIRSRLIFLRTYLRWPQMVLYATRELMYLRRIGQLMLHRQYHHIPWYLKGLVQGLCWPLGDGTHTIPRIP